MSTDNKTIKVQIDSDLKELIPQFLSNRRNDIEKIRSMLVSGDLEGIKLIGHTMKGNGSGYGFDKISELGLSIEFAAKENKLDEVGRLVDELALFLESIEIEYI